MSKKELIIEEIRKIYDPELPVNIYELGLIYDVKVEDGIRRHNVEDGKHHALGAHKPKYTQQFVLKVLRQKG